MPSKLSQLARHCQGRAPLKGLLWLGTALLLVWLGGSRVLTAQVPSAVDLIYFHGEGGDGVAYLEWETGTENDTAGFRLERAGGASGPFVELADIGFVPARGSVSAGAYYEETDDTAVNGQTYWYKLLEYTQAGTVGNEWTVRVSIEPEPTSQVIGGGGGTATATDTPVPTSTIGPTATGSPASATPAPGASPSGSNSGPTATNTARPTATNQPTRTPLAAATATNSTETAVTTRSAIFTATPATDEQDGVEAVGAPATIVAEAGLLENRGGDSPYPGSEEDAAAGLEVAANAVEAAVGEGDGLSPGVRAVGSGANDGEAEAGGDATVVLQEEGSSSLLLWLGFIAALFIFVGGIALSIFLSTRKRDGDL